MNIKKTKFKDLLIYEKIYFSDKRGYFLELFKDNNFKKKFPFTCFSYSKKNVLRGLHIQTKNTQGKFMSVLKGRVLDVALDLRAKSKTFGKHFMIELSEKNSKSIYIPEGFAHGFHCLDKENYVVYSCTNYRHARSEVGIVWNDKDLKIKWPNTKPIISNKDKNSLTFNEYCLKFIK
jgi:dTDP-4-dehydrorhamnose 3,5-epimerase